MSDPKPRPDFITVVSGLPRSGTSLMMQMLAAGGIPPLTDELRAPDESNPRGYFELEAVKKLRTDQSWLDRARGRSVKIIHLLLRELPVDGRYSYRVIFMKRPLGEVLASQSAMLARQGKPSADPAMLEKIYAAQLSQVEEWLSQQSCFSVLNIDHRRALQEAPAVGREVADFLGADLDLNAMTAAVDPALWREK